MAYCPNSDCPQPQNESMAKFCQTCGTPLLLDGRYRLCSLLGQGGFGRTFLAERLDPAADSRCVIKQLHRKALSDSLDFIDEAERLRKLGEHPQIPRLIDDFDNALGQFLVQEFAPGENLQQQVEAKGPWTEAAVRSLLKSLIVVLQYVHSFQIIHRDIKPANIVAAVNAAAPAENRRVVPMLVDFGSAKWVRQTPAQTVIGSAGYASPEQSMGQATFSSDIYSLGLTCLYLLTGIHPFQLYSAVEDRWVWQDYLATPLEPRLVQVLNQMVARSLQQRYASAEQVALDLQFSQNLRLNAPQQLIAQAKKTKVSGLKNLLQAEGNAVIERLNLGAAGKSLRSKALGQAVSGSISPTLAQAWPRLSRIAPDIGLTQALAISSDARLLASGGSDGTVRLWQWPQMDLLHTFARRRFVGTGHRGAVTALAFHPDNRALYSASEDGTVKEWDAAARQLLNTLSVAGWAPTDLAITPDGTQLICSNRDGKIRVWEISSLLPTAQLAQHQLSVNAIAVTNLWSFFGDPLGEVMASASDDGTVKLWRQKRRRPAQAPVGQSLSFQLVTTLNLQRDLRALASASSSAKAVSPAKDLRAIAVRMRTVHHNAYQLVIATDQGSLLLYNVDEHLSASEPVLLHVFPHAIKLMVLSADHILAVGTEDSVLTLWQLETSSCVAQLPHDWAVSAIAFTPDGRSLITASDDETLSIWHHDD